MGDSHVYRSGAYGCIFTPPMSAVSESRTRSWVRKRRDHVGKVFFQLEAGLQEIEAMFYVNRHVDPENRFTVPLTTANFVRREDVINANVNSRFMCVSFFEATRRSSALGTGSLGGWSNGFPAWFKITREDLDAASLDALARPHPSGSYLQLVYPFAGRTLQEEVSSPRVLPTTQSLVRGLLNVFYGVRALTNKFLVHQDIKDNNICVGETGLDMRIIDLGVMVSMSRLVSQGRETLETAKAPEYRVHLVHHLGRWRRDRSTPESLQRQFVREACVAMQPFCRDEASRAQAVKYARWYWTNAVLRDESSLVPLTRGADPSIRLRGWNGISIRARTRFDSARVGFADRIDVYMLGSMLSEFMPTDLMPRASMTAMNPADRPSIDDVIAHFEGVIAV